MANSTDFSSPWGSAPGPWGGQDPNEHKRWSHEGISGSACQYQGKLPPLQNGVETARLVRLRRKRLTNKTINVSACDPQPATTQVEPPVTTSIEKPQVTDIRKMPPKVRDSYEWELECDAAD